MAVVANGKKLFKKTQKKELEEFKSTKDGLHYFNYISATQGYTVPDACKVLYWIVIVANRVVSNTLGPYFFTAALFQTEGIDANQFLARVYVQLDVIGGTAKALCLHYHLANLRKIGELCEKMDARYKDPKEIKERSSGIRSARQTAMAYIMLYCGYNVAAYIGAAMVGRPTYCLKLPFIDWQRSTLEMHVQSVIEFYLINTIVIQNMFNDAYGAVYLAILDGHMRALLLRVQNLGKNPNMSLKENLEELKLCIKDHKHLLEYQDLIGPILSKTLFIQFVLTAMLLASVLLSVIFFADSAADVIGPIFYLVGVCWQCFPACFYATRLEFNSNRLATAIFHSEWFGQSHEYRKMLLFFIHKSQYPMKFIAGKIFDISVQTFISLAKFSFTLYTFAEEMDLASKLGF